jgi:hypothetical protein
METGKKKGNVIGKRKRRKLGRGKISKKSQHMEGIRKEKKYFQKCGGGKGIRYIYVWFPY